MYRPLAIFPLLLVAAGCHHDNPAASKAADRAEIRESWNPKPFRNTNQPAPAIALAEGPTPLVYLAESPGPIRVMDQNTNQRVAFATVPRHALVRVDDRNGVIVANRVITPGPLPAGHRYAIYSDEPSIVDTKH